MNKEALRAANSIKPIHVLLEEDKRSGFWSAQCLEVDIATQAKTYDEIMLEIPRVLKCHIAYAKRHSIEPFSNLKSAPAAYWKMYYYKKYSKDAPSMESPSTNTPVEGRILNRTLQPC